jgi:hypothetical protein
LRRIAGLARSNSMTINVRVRRNDQLARMQGRCKPKVVQPGWLLRGVHNRGGQILLTARFCGNQLPSFRRTGSGAMAVFDARRHGPDTRNATTQRRATRSAKWRDEHSQHGSDGNGAHVRPPAPVRRLRHPYSQRNNATLMNTWRQCGLHFARYGVRKDSNPFLPNTRERMGSFYFQLCIRARLLAGLVLVDLQSQALPTGVNGSEGLCTARLAGRAIRILQVR